MLLTREFYDPALIFIAAMSLCASVLMAGTVLTPFAMRSTPAADARRFAAAILISAAAAFLVTSHARGTIAAATAVTSSVIAVRLILPRLSMAGAMAMGTMPASLFVGAPWIYLLFLESGAPGWLLIPALLVGAIATLSVVLGFAEQLARNALLTHDEWRRPHDALPARSGAHPSGATPKVSIHLPCYAEPPEVVIETLDRLARLDYANFEVLVCDNNTPDEALWRPVERHCAWLNRTHDRFRFFHVAPIEGAKAGALNICLDRMAPDADLVAVIDADYLSKPDFLSRLVGFFDDPAIGYVQTPHDYRVTDDSAYLGACYWEYMPNNKVDLAGLNEYAAAFTIGTMCVIRTEALEQAGRWAEWCLTEDSEVSVRLRALGYEGIYLRDTFGRGLIPDTFDDYKKQRFRWTAGPVQQLRRHWRLYLPGRLAAPSALTGWSKLLEFQRGIAPVLAAVSTMAGVAGTALLVGLAANGTVPAIDLPAAAWVAFALATASMLVGRWHRYRLSGCESIGAMVAGETARLSLTYVQLLAGVAGLSTRPLAWRRTPKFGSSRSAMRALASTVPETVIGLGTLALLSIPLDLAGQLGGDVTTMIVIGGLMFSATFLTAPLMAILSERRLARAEEYADATSGLITVSAE